MDTVVPASVHAAVMSSIEYIYTFEKYVAPTVVLGRFECIIARCAFGYYSDRSNGNFYLGYVNSS